ncbi:MAG: hypothetical protein H0V56_08215 [Chthoniobacterales bacterium]|nr:hypothetical protein [Chthoniobacterales bacterium]
MIADIRSQLARTPFMPFAIRTSDGNEYPVPSLDHILISPRGGRIIVTNDEDTVAVLPTLHISAIVHQVAND